jgi:hypothetical protein
VPVLQFLLTCVLSDGSIAALYPNISHFKVCFLTTPSVVKIM